ncbi:MAG: gamma-butyrobetaine hydroxylase family protein [Rhodocyclaceae bacterium]
MAGLDSSIPSITEIKLHQKSREMELSFADGSNFRLSFEFLRVNSPSAEVRGHGPGEETLQTGKRNVDITALEPVGNYAVLPFFSDGHDTGIFSWDLLYRLGKHRDALWADYLERLEAAGASRDIDSTTLPPKSGGSCSKH